jgi:hypothetical protein
VLVAVLLLVSSAVRAQDLTDPQPKATDVEPQSLAYEAAVAEGRIPRLTQRSTAEPDAPDNAFVRWIGSPGGVAIGLSAAMVLACWGKRRRAVSVPAVRGRLLQDGRLLRRLEEASRRPRDQSTDRESARSRCRAGIG